MSVVIKTIVLYIVVVAALRIMGKRQIGELQPSELVITLLVSEIAAVPIGDPKVKVQSILLPLTTLIVFELIISFFNIKSVRIRNLIQGNSAIIIRDGKVDQKKLKSLRYSLEDVLEELRKRDVFDIKDVQYAIAETDGKISVLSKPEKRPLTPSDIHLKVSEDTIPVTVIDDGAIIEDSLKECKMTVDKVNDFLDKRGIKKEKVLLLQMTASGDETIIMKRL